jgi:alkylmercury lyase
MAEEHNVLQLLTTEKTDDEQALCRAAFRAILAGEPADRAGLTAATGFPSEKVDSLLNGLNTRGLVAVEPNSDKVIGSWGLSAAPTDHAIHIRNRELFTWCAVDAIGIPAGLKENAMISSRCHHCSKPIRLEMIAGDAGQVEPEDVRLWVTRGEAGRSVVGFT